jgi:hypothetical protein
VLNDRATPITFDLVEGHPARQELCPRVGR